MRSHRMEFTPITPEEALQRLRDGLSVMVSQWNDEVVGWPSDFYQLHPAAVPSIEAMTDQQAVEYLMTYYEYFEIWNLTK